MFEAAPEHHSHQHGPQLEEVVVFWVLHLHHPPWVQATSDLLPLRFNLLVGSYYCKWDASLEKRIASYDSCRFKLPYNELCAKLLKKSDSL